MSPRRKRWTRRCASASPSIRLTRGEGWSTIEEPIELARAVADAPESAPVVVDCITLWLSNLMLGQHDVDAAVARFIKCLDGRRAPTIVVSSEVGAGLVPETPLGRAFRDQAGLSINISR